MATFLKQKRVTVSTAGTSVQVDAALKPQVVIVTADPSNSGTVYVGDINVDASAALGQPIGANESLELSTPQQFGVDEQLDLSKFYVDATANGDAVIVSYYVREVE